MPTRNDSHSYGNRLYFGDNLEILRSTAIPDGSVDLIYLDPPFNSQAQYNVLFQSPRQNESSAQAGAFVDTWRWGEEAEVSYKEIMQLGGSTAQFIGALKSALRESDLMAYLVMMAVRLEVLRTKLKPTGSLYLHCDPTASHYLKVILDGIFGPSRFVGDVVWRRTNARGTKERWPRLHDTILQYSMSEDFVFNAVTVKADKAKLPHTLITGSDGKKYQTFELTGAGVTKDGESGKPWRGQDPSLFGRHWGNSLAQREEWDASGLIHWPKDGGFPRRRDEEPFDPESRKVVVGDVWTDIDRLNQTAKERRGYPTQKPVALLERIIDASSNKGGVVLDPFCGCGTTIDAAQRKGRQWIGIDIAIHAIKVIEARLAEHFPRLAYKVEGIPRDFASAVRLAEDDKYQFQWWANYLFNPHALREQKKGMDRGVDGDVFFPNGPGRPWGRVLTSVKGGDNVGPAMVRDFARVIQREKAEMGLFICLRRPTREMQREATSVGVADTVHGNIPKLQIVAIEDWFEGKLPKLPPLEHLPSAAFSTARRRPSLSNRIADPNQPELPLSFIGGKGKKQDVVHLNRSMVIESDTAPAPKEPVSPGTKPRRRRADQLRREPELMLPITGSSRRTRDLPFDEPLLIAQPANGKRRVTRPIVVDQQRRASLMEASSEFIGEDSSTKRVKKTKRG